MKIQTDGVPLQKEVSLHFRRLQCNRRNRLNIPPIHGHKHDDQGEEEEGEIVVAKEVAGVEVVVVITVMTMGAVAMVATRLQQQPRQQQQPQRLPYLLVSAF